MTPVGPHPERYTPVDDVAAVPAGSVDMVCCFETLELHDPEIASFVDQSGACSSTVAR